MKYILKATLIFTLFHTAFVTADVNPNVRETIKTRRTETLAINGAIQFHSLALEPSIAYNLVTRGTQSIGSAGLAIGFDHMVATDISIGGSAGFEFFGADLSLANYAQMGSLRFSPKVLIETSISL